MRLLPVPGFCTSMDVHRTVSHVYAIIFMVHGNNEGHWMFLVVLIYFPQFFIIVVKEFG